MNWSRRISLPWLVFGAVVICAWCSVISLAGGWIMGQDIARREAQIERATALSDQPSLPPLGVVITRVDRTGPAALAGLQRGDLITAIDNTPIESARDLRERLDLLKPGDSVRLSLLRQRSELLIEVKLSAFPDNATRSYLGVYFTARGDEPGDL